MRSTYRSLTQQYLHLKDLTLDVNYFLQNPENYSQFDERIKAVLVNNANIPEVQHLPQVKFLKAMREVIQVIANDFESEKYTKLVNLTIHLKQFWQLVKAYRLTERTLALSPEFNSKVVSFTNLVLQTNQIFHEELKKISGKPNLEETGTYTKYDNDATKNWRYYRKKIIAFDKMLPADNKLKPYLKNADRALTFIIDLKEKGILKSNLIFSVLDFVESFNDASQTSLKEIFQEYALFSENEIKEIIKHINHFLSSFMAICDEVEINMGLKMGYLTSRLDSILNFCNVLDHEFNQTDDFNYPYKLNRLTRIQRSNEQTDILLDAQKERKQKLEELNNIIQRYLEEDNFDIDDIVKVHEGIELLLDDDSYKKYFHDVIDKELNSLASELNATQKESFDFEQLLTKYKLHEANLTEARLLFANFPIVAKRTGRKYYKELAHEYTKITNDFRETIAKVEQGELTTKDIKHILIMINIFEILNKDAFDKSELVREGVNKQIEHVKKLQELLDQFANNRLADQDMYLLLNSLHYLDCDNSIKEKYKKQIIDLDHKRKNYSYMRMISDFALSMFTEVTVPFAEINQKIQDKLNELEEIKNDRLQPGTINISRNIPSFPSSVFDFTTIFSWRKLTERIEFSLNETSKQVETLEGILKYKEERYKQLENSLNAYQPPVKIPRVKELPPREPFSLKRFFSNILKTVTNILTDGITNIYSKVKSAYLRFKSLFSRKEPEKIIITPSSPLIPLKPIKKEIDKTPYKQLNFIEENISYVLEKLVNPAFHASLKNALTTHQMISIDKDSPYFYQQGASIANIYILFRKVFLSYSHWDMLQLTIAISELNAENKSLILGILNNSTLAQTSIYYNNVIKPALSGSYRIAANVNSDMEFTTSLPQVMQNIHESIRSIGKNESLDLKPLLQFLNRIGDDLKRSQQPLNEDLLKIYSSVNNLTKFVEKVINNQDNFLVEALFSLAHLSKQFRQLSSSITHLLIKDQFPYIKELSLAMQQLQDILLLFQNNLHQLLQAGLNPALFNSLNESIEGTKKLVFQLTPIKIREEYILRHEQILSDIEEIKSYLSKRADKKLKNELDNIAELLTKPSALEVQKIDGKLLAGIESRLGEIKLKIRDSYSHSVYGFFNKKIPFNQPEKDMVKDNKKVLSKS